MYIVLTPGPPIPFRIRHCTLHYIIHWSAFKLPWQLRWNFQVATCKLQVTTCNKQLATDLYHSCNKRCKEMGGATSVMPVIRDAFSQQAADTTQWLIPSIGRTLWLATNCKHLHNTVVYTHNIMLMRSARLARLVSFIIVVNWVLPTATVRYSEVPTQCTRGIQKVLQLDHKEEWKCYKLHFIFQHNLNWVQCICDIFMTDR